MRRGRVPRRPYSSVSSSSSSVTPQERTVSVYHESSSRLGGTRCCHFQTGSPWSSLVNRSGGLCCQSSWRCWSVWFSSVRQPLSTRFSAERPFSPSSHTVGRLRPDARLIIAVPCACMLLGGRRRLNKMAPNRLHNLGRWGVVCNIVAVFFTAQSLVIFCFPAQVVSLSSELNRTSRVTTQRLPRVWTIRDGHLASPGFAS